MKKLYLLLIITVLAVSITKAQVAINKTGTSADTTAMLDVKSANKGMLIPRVALTGTNDVTTIPAATTSLLVYNTATTSAIGTAVTPGYYYWNGSAWAQFATSSDIVNVPEVVNMRGLYTAATTYAQNDLISTGTNRDTFYFSLASANVGKTPASSPRFWQLVEVEQLKVIHKTLSLATPGFTSLLSMSLTGTNTAGGRIQYTIRAIDAGTQLVTEQGVIQYVATANSITCSADATDKVHLGTVNSACSPGFFSPASQPGISVSDNITFTTAASIAVHDVYFRIYQAAGQLVSGSYSKVRLRIEP